MITGSSGIGQGAALKFALKVATEHLCEQGEEHHEKAWEKTAGLDVNVAEIDVTLPAQLRSWIQVVGSNGGIEIS